jgi:hypothetical protein
MIDLDDWNDNHILCWILDTEKNDIIIRRFLVDYWLWRHRNYSTIRLYGGIVIRGENQVKNDLDFWKNIFVERWLLDEEKK